MGGRIEVKHNKISTRIRNSVKSNKDKQLKVDLNAIDILYRVCGNNEKRRKDARDKGVQLH